MAPFRLAGQRALYSASMNLTNSHGGGSRPNNGGGSAKLSGEPRDRLNRWFNTSVCSHPSAFTFGKASRKLPDVRKDGPSNLDLGVLKNNRFDANGRMNLKFRAEFFNALNRVRFSHSGLSFGSPQFGNINSRVNSPRLIQMAQAID